MKIDSHQHFWNYTAADYPWIGPGMEVLARSFLPDDLAPLLKQAGLDGCVAVQARQTVGETEWLLGLADRSPLVKGVVGWVPLRDEGSGVGRHLDRFLCHPAFKGVRHVLQDEPDDYFGNEAFHAGLREVTSRELVYDLLVYARQLPAALALVDRHPGQVFVLDHIAKPVAAGAPPAEWVAQIRELAKRERVWCKFSGLATEVPGRRWTPELLSPYFEVVLEAFGPERLMYGSDWPVCLLATDYARWQGFAASCVVGLSDSERSAFFGGNAARAYGLGNKN